VCPGSLIATLKEEGKAIDGVKAFGEFKKRIGGRSEKREAIPTSRTLKGKIKRECGGRSAEGNRKRLYGMAKLGGVREKRRFSMTETD